MAAHDLPDAFAYTALIRTQDSLPRVERTIASLRAQSVGPAVIIAVDASSDPGQKAALAKLVDLVVDYPDAHFNYSKAINLGMARCTTPYVLIISSHVRLQDHDLVWQGVRTLLDSGALGFYFQTSPNETWDVTRIDRRNFNGRNGLSNTCAFLPASSVLQRPFREEVFSAEDQEWAAHQLRVANASLLRIRTTALHYENPHWNELKYINEEVSIAYYTCREKLGAQYLFGRLVKCTVALLRGRTERARTEWTIYRALLRARSTPPVRTSSYY